jgi:hypothetical protein|tara:strand:- start:246 stop:347 length:102 start_codon:yes stop_codon:yes gene_type:complete
VEIVNLTLVEVRIMQAAVAVLVLLVLMVVGLMV